MTGHAQNNPNSTQPQYSSTAQAQPPQALVTLSPSLHYVSLHVAKAVFHEDTIVFVAYDKAWKKRILHTFKESDGLSFYQQRPLYEEIDPVSHRTDSVFDLLVRKFEDDSASLHLILPRSSLSPSMRIESPAIKTLVAEFEAMSSRLPVIPFGIAHHAMSPPLSEHEGEQRSIVVMSKEIAPDGESPVSIDKKYTLLNKGDIL
ncbi:hypothetical protein K461DRAFT_277600 [Myriangium duriaei CBS 260.36]|uniref:Uncharacterized protein n=1 Tax=Myriangium duriaei CBS 260.36 TaxID=1168546 RepID=A0A9P4MLS3_9PEZI|nr:hypothetical protein K461DRAFT_277600 [Myriangium duriaei CBS 260.36]